MVFGAMAILEKCRARENGLQTFYPLFTQGMTKTGTVLTKEQGQLNSADFSNELK